jgi:hypothetical protein
MTSSLHGVLAPTSLTVGRLAVSGVRKGGL